MQVELETMAVPAMSSVEIDIKVRAQTQVSATAAQRKVTIPPSIISLILSMETRGKHHTSTPENGRNTRN